MGSLFVHGWMVTGRVWRWMAPRFSDAIIASTIPSPPEAATATLDSLARSVIDQAAGLERFDLVGHSMGGQVAALVAAAIPERVRSLALVNPVPLSGLSLPPEVATFFRSSGGNRAAQGGILDQACLQLSPADKEAMLDDAGSISPEWIARSFDLFATGGDRAKLASIRCPTVVVATDDPFLPAQLLQKVYASKISGARLEILRGPGHYPQVEQPDALAAVLAAFQGEAAR